MNRVQVLGSALLVAAVLTGCSSSSGSVREVTLTATEMKFEPALVQARPGEKIKFTVVNSGTVDHEFESEEIKFDELIVPPGKSRSLVVTMPEKPGEYAFLCDADGHHAAGMSGKIVVSQ